MKLQNLSSGQPQWTPSSQSCHAAGRLWKRSFPVAPHHDHGKPRNEWSSYFLDTTLAKRMKYIVYDGTIIGPYLGDISTPEVFGHAAGPNTISVAAYEVNRAPFSANPPFTPELEDFTSPGPVTIA